MRNGTLFTTVCNDRFTNALALLMWSVKLHNPDFSHPLKVYHKGDLALENQERILRIYPHTVFDNVSKGEYQEKIPHYLALESFREEEPERVVFVDSDIICTGDISVLATLDHPLCAALDYKVRFGWFMKAPFPLTLAVRLNTGVFILGRKYRNRSTYEGLYGLLDKFPAQRVKGMAWSDQGIMNQYFRRITKVVLPYQYNARKNLYPNKVFTDGLERGLGGARLLHYGGTCKPFLGGLKGVPPGNKNHRYSKLHEIYYQYWDRMVKSEQLDWKLEDRM